MVIIGGGMMGIELLAAWALLGAPAWAGAGETDALEALVAADGAITIRDGGERVAEVTPGYFLKGWNYQSLRGKGEAREGETEREIAISGEGRIGLKSRVGRDGNSLILRYRAVPSASLTVESVHVSVNFRASEWAGAEYRFGEEEGVVPVRHKDIHVAAGETGELRLGPSARLKGLVAEMEFRKAGHVLLQDSRRWTDQLEVRIGEQKPTWTWNAGEPVEVEFLLAFNRPLELVYDSPVILKADENWIPLSGKLEIQKGSALDYSGRSWMDAPAGKHGWLRLSQDSPGTHEFTKKPGKPARFYGANFCFTSLYPERDLADRVAERLMRLGYNTVRIHHYESMEDPLGLVSGKGPDSLTFNAEMLDRLDYFFAALKKRGIYMTTDLYVSRYVRLGEIYPGASGSAAYGFKRLVHISEKAFENYKEFARRLLTHVNPYTGLSYAEDPAMPWISLINEGNLPNSMSLIREDPRDAELWDAAFARWKERTGTRGEWGSPACVRFLWETHISTQRRIIKFLREELKVKALLTDLNGWTDHWGTQVCRTDYDYVDNHYYWDHPSFLEREWNLPTRGWSGGGSAIKAGGGFLQRCLTRLLDRPFSISEFDFVAPNPHRAEGALLMAACAAIQDWSVLWRFGYSHSLGNLGEPKPMRFFDTAADPLRLLSEYAALDIFLRRDVPPARTTIAVTGSRKDYLKEAHRHLGGEIQNLAWCFKIGTEVGKRKKGKDRISLPLKKALGNKGLDLAFAKAGKRLGRENRTDPASGIFESEGGNVHLDTRAGVMCVSAPLAAGLAGPPGTRRVLGPVTIEIDETWALVWLSSLDGRPLVESSRMLVLHLTDLANTEQRFRGRDMSVLEEWGRTPYLVRAGKAAFRLEHARPAGLKAWRLALDGSRTGPAAADSGKGAITLALDIATSPEATLAYEIVR